MRFLTTPPLAELAAGAAPGFGPPSVLHGWLSRRFDGALVRRREEGPWTLYEVDLGRRSSRCLAIDAAVLATHTEWSLSVVLDELDVCGEMDRRRGRRIRVRQEDEKLVVEID